MSIMNSRLLAAMLAAGMIVPASGRADELAAKVATRIKDSGSMSGYRVAVRSDEKTVFLEGAVGSPKQIEMAVITAENTPGVERVVNRLSVSQRHRKDSVPFQAASESRQPVGLSLPTSMKAIFGGAATSAGKPAKPRQDPFQLVEATEPVDVEERVESQAVYPAAVVKAREPAKRPAAGPAESKPLAATAAKPRAVSAAAARPMARQSLKRAPQPGIARTSGLEGQPPLIVGDGEIVPGSERIVNDTGDSGGSAMARGGYSGGYAGGVQGRPLPMGAGGVGMPVVSTSGEGPNMPNYAWPSYAASPNYAAVQYPTQYSPTAWPYIGPFYPYPQVPLGWRRVSLEWDDGWWFLDFDDDHHRRGHHRY